ncbi:MAG: hypothetical protein ACE5D2_08640, partial [Fidelibacterota bacterium]
MLKFKKTITAFFRPLHLFPVRSCYSNKTTNNRGFKQEEGFVFSVLAIMVTLILGLTSLYLSNTVNLHL